MSDQTNNKSIDRGGNLAKPENTHGSPQLADNPCDHNAMPIKEPSGDVRCALCGEVLRDYYDTVIGRSE